MDSHRWLALEKRLVQLEVRIGDLKQDEDLSTSLQKITTQLQKYKPLNILLSKLSECNVDYTTDTTSNELKGKDRDMIKEVVLNSYDLLNSCVDKMEFVMGQYDSFFSKFKVIHRQLLAADIFNRRQLLSSFERIQDKFTQILSRLIILLEKRTILRYKQEELMISINDSIHKTV